MPPSKRRVSPMPLTLLSLITYCPLLWTPAPRPWLFLSPSLTLVTGSMSSPFKFLSLHFPDLEFRTCLHYCLAVPIMEEGSSVPYISYQQTLMVTIWLVVEVTGTESTVTTLSGTHYILQHNLLLWRPGEKCPH